MWLIFPLLLIVIDANIIHDWSLVARRALSRNGTNLPVSTRFLAMFHVALHDSVNSVTRIYRSYRYSLRSAPKDASIDTCIASAAYQMLRVSFPKQNFDSIYAEYIGAFPPSLSVTDGIYVGWKVVETMLADKDRALLPYKVYIGSLQVGKWRPTPPQYFQAMTPEWGNAKPWCSASPIKMDPPNQTTYSADSSVVPNALFWVPSFPDKWFQAADQLTADMTPAETARVYCVLSLGLADAAIHAWYNLYYHGLWRPITAVQDPAWRPMFETPNYPEYPAERSVFGGVAAAILPVASFFLAQQGQNVSFASVEEAARQEGEAVVYGGIHFNGSVMAGFALAREIAAVNCLQQLVVSPPMVFVEDNLVAIVLVAVGTGILLVALVAIVWYRRRRNRRTKEGTYVNLIPI